MHIWHLARVLLAVLVPYPVQLSRALAGPRCCSGPGRPCMHAVMALVPATHEHMAEHRRASVRVTHSSTARLPPASCLRRSRTFARVDRRPVTFSVASLMPPASTSVQLTHALDLAGASVFALLSELDGVFHVASAPITMQQLFDTVAERREWLPMRLREAAHEGDDDRSGAGAALVDAADGASPRASPYWATEKLERAGYRLMRPQINVAAASYGVG